MNNSGLHEDRPNKCSRILSTVYEQDQKRKKKGSSPQAQEYATNLTPIWKENWITMAFSQGRPEINLKWWFYDHI